MIQTLNLMENKLKGAGGTTNALSKIALSCDVAFCQPTTIILAEHPSLCSVMWEVRVAGVKGLGVFANSFIPRGTRIFSERPLLAILKDQDTSTLYRATRRLSSQDRETLLDLSSHATKEKSLMRWNLAFWYIIKQTFSDLKIRIGGNGSFVAPRLNSVKEHVSVLNIFRSNAFNLGVNAKFQQAVFPGISRINHSCIPNAQGNFHDVLGKFNVHAIRDIEVGEELTLSYLREHGALQASRQSSLFNGYTFNCDCPACDLTSIAGQKGEQSRSKMHDTLREFAEYAGAQNHEEELRVIQLFIDLLEGEGIAGREVATMHLEAARLSQLLGHSDNALGFAEKGLEIEKDCLGTDHPLYQESLKLVQDMQATTAIASAETLHT
ncbi:TPR domain-containing protein [Phlyctema vagabunda]|uniref:TPR domain-containing protein n=1 Tax=Phlyctema vagabunda TaxID=108571 RepID=A0ABR4P7X0_9HELO